MKFRHGLVSTLIFVVFAIPLTILMKASGKEEPAVSKDEKETKTLSQPEISANHYAEYLQSEFDSTKTVGAAVTIVYDGQTLLTKTFGVKKSGTRDSIDRNTIFRLASTSKGFAGVLACILENEGILSLDDKIIDHLPSFKLKDSINTYQLTLKHTLSHTTGLVPHAFDNLAEAGITMKNILPRLAEVDISAIPGHIYGYQNVTFSILDTMLSVYTGNTFSRLLDQKIFAPLEMYNASTGKDVFLNKNNNIAYPHVKRGSSYTSIPPNKALYTTLPAAGVNASISDLSKWLLALLGNQPHAIDSLVLNMIQTPLVITPLKRKYTHQWGKVDSREYSLGWRIFSYKGRKIIYHGGYVRGYRAEIAFCPEESIGIAFLQNSPNAMASKSIPRFLNLWFDDMDSTNILSTMNQNPDHKTTKSNDL